jgi:hypothetical protein
MDSSPKEPKINAVTAAFAGYPYPRSALRRGVCKGVIYSAYSFTFSVSVKMIMKSLLTWFLNFKQTILIGRRQEVIALNPCCYVWCPLRIEHWNRRCDFCSPQRYLFVLSIALCYFLFALYLTWWHAWGRKIFHTKFLVGKPDGITSLEGLFMYG